MFFQDCKRCGKNYHEFETVDEFCAWALSKENENCIFFAHNARGYDAQFVFDYLVKNQIDMTKFIKNGTELYYLKVRTFLNFLTLLRSVFHFSFVTTVVVF